MRGWEGSTVKFKLINFKLIMKQNIYFVDYIITIKYNKKNIFVIKIKLNIF